MSAVDHITKRKKEDLSINDDDRLLVQAEVEGMYMRDGMSLVAKEEQGQDCTQELAEVEESDSATVKDKEEEQEKDGEEEDEEEDEEKEAETDSDEDSDDEIEPSLEKVLCNAWEEVMEKVGKTIAKGYMIVTGKTYTKRTKPVDITMDYFWKTDHLILRRKIIDYAIKFANRIQRFKNNYPYGATGCNNTIWYQFMIPEMENVESFIKEKKWQDVFASLFGIYWYDRADESYWVHDQEVWLEKTIFSGWFKQYSASWTKLLEQSDEVLGLKCKGGIANGYRQNLMQYLNKQQEFLNKNVLHQFDEHSHNIRIDIIPKKSIAQSCSPPSKKSRKST